MVRAHMCDSPCRSSTLPQLTHKVMHTRFARLCAQVELLMNERSNLQRQIGALQMENQQLTGNPWALSVQCLESCLCLAVDRLLYICIYIYCVGLAD